MNKNDYRDMWVFIEHDGQSIQPVSLELCCEIRKIADAAGEKLVAVVVGSLPETEKEKLLDCGVDVILHVSGTGYGYFNVDAYANLFTVLCRKYLPTAVFVGGTINGRDFAPRFACRLPTGCTSDATELVWDPKTADIEFIEPAVGAPYGPAPSSTRRPGNGPARSSRRLSTSRRRRSAPACWTSRPTTSTRA